MTAPIDPSGIGTAPAEALAVVDRTGSLTYAELRERIARVGAGLTARGVGPGDHVLLVTANERESVAAYHAVTGLGAVAVLSHVAAGASELRAAADLTRPVLAVLSPLGAQLAGELPDGVPTVLSTDLDEAPTAAPATPDPDAPRVVLFTSGTTSLPKGVVHSGRTLRGAVACFTAMTGIGAADRMFLVSPIASITGVTQALEMAPTVGAAVVLESHFADEESLDLLLATGGTFYGGPDLVVDRLLKAAARRSVAVPLRLAALGGTMLRRELIDTAEAAGIRVIRVYGSSEVPWSTGTRPDEPDEVRLADEGVTGPGVELRLSDDGTRELLIRGPHQFAGYLDDAQTEAALEDGWFRTGDEAVLGDGRLKIVGRLKDVASRNGKKVSLPEVDAAFTTASGITDCAAFVVADDDTGERVAVAVVLADGADLDVPAVLAGMTAAGLARFKLPESVVRWPGALPTTATGKVQRRELSEDAPVLWQAPRLTARLAAATESTGRER